MKASAFLPCLLIVLCAAGCARQEPPAPVAAEPPADPIAAAVADESRPGTARVQDSFRRPAEILAFAGVDPGDTVVEIAPGQGYYTALLSRVVGDSGRVVAIDAERLFEFMPRARENFAAYSAMDPRDNVSYQSQRLDAPELPGSVDQIWMVLFYHDTMWLDVDRAAMNRAFFEALKPGGVYLVVDHRGADGAGLEIARDLHRAPAPIVRAEIEAAGFVLEAESDLLANPDDPRTDSAFADARRGKTDQFVWKFVKPQ